MKIDDMINKVIQGDCLSVLKTFADNSIDLVITSPPYFGLRKYLSSDHPDKSKEIGQENTIEEYIEKLLKITKELFRVLKKTGSFYFNIGDCYASKGTEESRFWHGENQGKHRLSNDDFSGRARIKNYPSKCMLMLPERLAIRLIEQGWILRNKIVWNKINSMPSSITDRYSNSYEFLYFLVKSRAYYFDLDIIRKNPKNVSISRYGRQSNPDNHKEPYQQNSPISNLCQKYKEDIYGEDKGNRARVRASLDSKHLKQDNMPSRNANTYKGFNERYKNKYQGTDYGGDGSSFRGHSGYFDSEGNYIGNIDGCNPRDVWSLPTYPEGDIEHYACFPPTLLIQPILSGCPENGIVLDPFMGSGTTGLVVKVLNRNYIGIELNDEFIKMAEQKIDNPDKQKIVVEQMRQKFPEIYEKLMGKNEKIAEKIDRIMVDKNQNLLW